MAIRQGTQVLMLDTVNRKSIPMRSGTQLSNEALSVTLSSDDSIRSTLDEILVEDTTQNTTLSTIQDNTYVDFSTRMSLGSVADCFNLIKWGTNDDVHTGAEELVAPWGTFSLSDIQTTPSTYTITYNIATDGFGTTGALSLLFSYLDENFEYQTAYHSLQNTGSDVTTFSGLGINRVVVFSNGGDGFNGDVITIVDTSTGSTQASIPLGTSVTQQCLYHTAVGRKVFVADFGISVLKPSGSNPVVTFRVYSYSRVTETRYQIKKVRVDTSIENNININNLIPISLSEKEVFFITVETDANNTVTSCRLGFQDMIA